MRKSITKSKSFFTSLFFILIICIGSYFNYNHENLRKNIFYDISNIPNYTGNIYIELNNNIPMFSEEDLNIKEDYYSELENGRVRNGNDKN